MGGGVPNISKLDFVSSVSAAVSKMIVSLLREPLFYKQ